MDNNDETYLSELQTQSRFALRAITYADLALRDNSDTSDIDEFWYHIQMFLVSIANVSKMMYQGSNKPCLEKYKVHHERIVSEYNLPDTFFIDEKRMRNSYEHYDENLINWLNKPMKVRGLNNIGPIDGFIVGLKFNYLKHYDPTTNLLHFDNKSINLTDAYDQLVVLDQHIEEILQQARHG